MLETVTFIKFSRSYFQFLNECSIRNFLSRKNFWTTTFDFSLGMSDVHSKKESLTDYPINLARFSNFSGLTMTTYIHFDSSKRSRPFLHLSDNNTNDLVHLLLCLKNENYLNPSIIEMNQLFLFRYTMLLYLFLHTMIPTLTQI